MDSTLVLPSPAEIALHLKVAPAGRGGQRPLLSLFQLVGLCGTLTVRSLKHKGPSVISGSFPFPPHENIIHRAVTADRRETGVVQGISVLVQKRVFVGAGLREDQAP